MPRYEWSDPNAALDVFPHQADLGEEEDCIEEGCYVLVIGDPDATAYVIEGQPESLRAVAQRLSQLLQRSLPREVCDQDATPT